MRSLWLSFFGSTKAVASTVKESVEPVGFPSIRVMPWWCGLNS